MSYVGRGHAAGQLLSWDTAGGGSYRWLPASAPTTAGQVLSWNGSEPVWITAPSGFTAGGDLSGTSTSQTVIRIQNRAVASTAPADGQVLTWNGSLSQWYPAAAPSGFTAGGDLSGTSTSQTVIRIQSRAVASTAPADGQVLAWDATGSTWKPATPAPPALAITQITMEKVVPGVGVTPGWEVLGAFVYNGAAAKLQAMVLVSALGLTVRVRLYGPTAGTAFPVPGSTITSTSLVEDVIESVELTSALTLGGSYQFQMECTGGGAVTDFAVARFMALVSV